MVKLFSKNFNLCHHNPSTSQTDRQTTCDLKTALCTKVHRAVKIKVPCRMSGIEWRVVYFRKLPFETNNEKFSLRRVKSEKICSHRGRNLLQNCLEVGNTWVKVTRMKLNEKLSIICVKVGGLEKMRRWECWVRWYTWQKVEDREQNLEEHHKKKCTWKRGFSHIWHGNNFCDPIALTKWSGMYTVWLFQWNDVCSRQIDGDSEDHWKQGKMTFDHFWIFDYFGYEREIGDQTIIESWSMSRMGYLRSVKITDSFRIG